MTTGYPDFIREPFSTKAIVQNVDLPASIAGSSSGPYFVGNAAEVIFSLSGTNGLSDYLVILKFWADQAKTIIIANQVLVLANGTSAVYTTAPPGPWVSFFIQSTNNNDLVATSVTLRFTPSRYKTSLPNAGIIISQPTVSLGASSNTGLIQASVTWGGRAHLHWNFNQVPWEVNVFCINPSVFNTTMPIGTYGSSDFGNSQHLDVELILPWSSVFIQAFNLNTTTAGSGTLQLITGSES